MTTATSTRNAFSRIGWNGGPCTVGGAATSDRKPTHKGTGTRSLLINQATSNNEGAEASTEEMTPNPTAKGARVQQLQEVATDIDSAYTTDSVARHEDERKPEIDLENGNDNDIDDDAGNDDDDDDHDDHTKRCDGDKSKRVAQQRSYCQLPTQKFVRVLSYNEHCRHHNREHVQNNGGTESENYLLGSASHENGDQTNCISTNSKKHDGTFGTAICSTSTISSTASMSPVTAHVQGYETTIAPEFSNGTVNVSTSATTIMNDTKKTNWMGLNVSKRQFIAFLRYNNVTMPSQQLSQPSLRGEIGSQKRKLHNYNYLLESSTIRGDRGAKSANNVKDKRVMASRSSRSWITVEEVCVGDGMNTCLTARKSRQKEGQDDKWNKGYASNPKYADGCSNGTRTTRTRNENEWHTAWKEGRLITSRTELLAQYPVDDLDDNSLDDNDDEDNHANSKRYGGGTSAATVNSRAVQSDTDRISNGIASDSPPSQSQGTAAADKGACQSKQKTTNVNQITGKEVSNRTIEGSETQGSNDSRVRRRGGFVDTIGLYVDRIVSIYRDEIIENNNSFYRDSIVRIGNDTSPDSDTSCNNFLLLWLKENYGVCETEALQQLYNELFTLSLTSSSWPEGQDRHLDETLDQNIIEQKMHVSKNEYLIRGDEKAAPFNEYYQHQGELVQQTALVEKSDRLLRQMKHFLEWFRATFPYYYDQCSHCGASFRTDSMLRDQQQAQQTECVAEPTEHVIGEDGAMAVNQTQKKQTYTNISDARTFVSSSPVERLLVEKNTTGTFCNTIATSTSVDTVLYKRNKVSSTQSITEDDNINEVRANNENNGIDHDDDDDDERTLLGYIFPNPDERLYGKATRTELYQCNRCSMYTRFPRYNSVRSIIEYKKGRCGEYSLLLFRILRALNFHSVRYVVDWADHVWCEIGLPIAAQCGIGNGEIESSTAGQQSQQSQQKIRPNVPVPPISSGKYQQQQFESCTGRDRQSEYQYRWVHLDPCEAAVDDNLLYQGWGKNQTYIIAFYIPTTSATASMLSFGALSKDTMQECTRIHRKYEQMQQELEQRQVVEGKLNLATSITETSAYSLIPKYTFTPLVEDVTGRYTTQTYDEILRRRIEFEGSVEYSQQDEIVDSNAEQRTPSLLPSSSIVDTRIRNAIQRAKERLRQKLDQIAQELQVVQFQNDSTW